MAKPHSVLLVKGSYGRAGGPETLLTSILAHLDETRFRPTLVLLRKSGGLDALGLTEDGLTASRQRIEWHGILAAPLAARSLDRVRRGQEAVLIHTHDMRANLVAYTLTRSRRIPWIAHVHGWLGATHTWRWRVYEAIEKRLIRYADLVLVGSHAAKEEVQALDVKTVKVIPNAIEVPSLPSIEEKATSLRTTLGIPPTALIVGMAGRLHPGKGQALLIQALADLIKDRGAKLHGLIVGEGSDFERLQQLAHELGIHPHLTFIGYCPEVLPFVRAMDIVVAPSLKESLPLTVLEAMALQRPVVASRVGDLPTVITSGENGLLVPPGDVPALRNAIAILAGSAELRHRLGRQAHQHILQHFSAATMTRTLEGVYKDLLTQRSAIFV